MKFKRIATKQPIQPMNTGILKKNFPINDSHRTLLVKNSL